MQRSSELAHEKNDVVEIVKNAIQKGGEYGGGGAIKERIAPPTRETPDHKKQPQAHNVFRSVFGSWSTPVYQVSPKL